MKKSGLIAREQQRRALDNLITRVHTRAWILDVVTITLGQMGFTPEDLKLFCEEYMKTEQEYSEEINTDYKSDKHLDYAADKIDRVLKQYVPEEMFVPFDERHKVNFL